jgi:hypothetical protein
MTVWNAVDAEEFAKRFEGRVFGASVVVEEAFGRYEHDSEGEPALFVDLILSDPVDGTWPSDDMAELRRTVIGEATEAGVGVALYVSVAPRTDSPQVDDEPSLFGT